MSGVLNTNRLNKQFLELPRKPVSGSSSNVPPTMVARAPRQMFGNNAPYCAGGPYPSSQREDATLGLAAQPTGLG